ncbi:hypothetical protein BDFB_000083 [Asbolus verrucosus]|uniref:C2H2-type domain-containing protein n=1 Tax=Asbolus verrucosus TaxID=1661398 RepID=A0A482V7L5_ASBVE|nr:hypothetical protein BDFB_000083 [Asbolus verrucosus]
MLRYPARNVAGCTKIETLYRRICREIGYLVPNVGNTTKIRIASSRTCRKTVAKRSDFNATSAPCSLNESNSSKRTIYHTVLYLAQNVINGTKISTVSPLTCLKIAEKYQNTSARSVTVARVVRNVKNGTKTHKVWQHIGPKTAEKERSTSALFVRVFGHVARSASDGETAVICPQCDKYYKNIASLRCHMSLDCGKGRNFECGVCHSKFKRKQHLKDHMYHRHALIVLGEKITCPACNKTYKNVRTLTTHRSQDCGKGHEKMFCPNCHKLYKNITTLAAHLRQDCKRGCPKCLKVYKNRPTLKVHLHQDCGKEIVYHCTICQLPFKRKYNLKRHNFFVLDRLCVTSVEERTNTSHPSAITKKNVIVCPKCGKTYKYNTSLHNHLKYECGKSKSFKCSLCSKSFWHKQSLKNHVNFKRCKINKVPDIFEMMQQQQQDIFEKMQQTQID